MPTRARRFVVGKLFAFTCFDGSRGDGRIYRRRLGDRHDPDAAAADRRATCGCRPGPLRVKGEAVCANAQGHAVRAVLQPEQDQRPELSRRGVRDGLRLLRLHPSQQQRRGQPEFAVARAAVAQPAGNRAGQSERVTSRALDDLAPLGDLRGAVVHEGAHPHGVPQVWVGHQPKLAFDLGDRRASVSPAPAPRRRRSTASARGRRRAAAASARPDQGVHLVDDALFVDVLFEPLQGLCDRDAVGEGDPVMPASVGERIEGARREPAWAIDRPADARQAAAGRRFRRPGRSPAAPRPRRASTD